MTKGERVRKWLADLGSVEAVKLAQALYHAFRGMVVAQHAIADGADRADEEVKGAVLAMQALAANTAAKVFKSRRIGRHMRQFEAILYDDETRYPRSGGYPTLPPMAPSLDLPPVSGEIVRRPRRQVSHNGRTWVDYDAMVDADPFETFKHRRTV